MKPIIFKILFLVAGLGMALWIVIRPTPSPKNLPEGWQWFPEPGAVLTFFFSKNQLFVGTKTGLHTFDTAEKKYLGSWDGNGAVTRIHAIAAAANDGIWLAHERGLTKKQGPIFQTFTKADGLPSSRVNAITPSSEESLWVGTADGLAICQNDTFTIQSFPLASPIINALSVGNEGSLWVGSISDPKGGITIITHDRLETFSTEKGLPHPFIHQFYADTDGAMWSVGGLFEKGAATRWKKSAAGWKISEVLTSKNGLPEDHVRSIFRDRDGNLWLGFENQSCAVVCGNTIRFLGKEDGFPSTEVTVFHQSADGFMWFGTLAGVVCASPMAIQSFKQQGRSQQFLLPYPK